MDFCSKILKSSKGLTLIEALVCLVIIGIGFIAVNQLTTFSISHMSTSIERNKINFLSQMVVEDMIGDSDNLSSYAYNESHEPAMSSHACAQNSSKSLLNM